MQKLQTLAVSMMVSAISCLSTSAAVFQGLGTLGGASDAAAVSPDGSAVVGKSDVGGSSDHGFLWRESTGSMIDLGIHATGQFYSQAHGVSNSLIVSGYADTDIAPNPTHFSGQAMRWMPPYPSAPEALPEQPSDPTQNFASFVGSNNSINGTGSLIVGWTSQTNFCSDEATVWVNGVPLGLGWNPLGPVFPPPDCGFTDYSYANAVNTPGSHIVGFSVSFGGIAPQTAVLWTDPTGQWATAPAIQALGQIGGDGVGTDSVANDITNDGSTVVGSGVDSLGSTVAWRGTVGNTNLVSLGDLAGGIVDSRALSVAGDGLTIVGWGTVANDVHEAFIWDPTLTGGTMVSLRSYLVNNQGLGQQLTGWTLQEARAISDDGRVIVGVGTNPSGQSEAFRVVLDIATAIDGDFDDDNDFDCDDVNLLSTAVATGGSVSMFDLNGDGSLTLADVDTWRAEAGENNLGPGRIYPVADANLDASTDGSDFGLWNANKFTSNTNYCSGNFNADLVVDGSDFGLWNANKFTSGDSASVPEPAYEIWMIGVLTFLGPMRTIGAACRRPAARKRLGGLR